MHLHSSVLREDLHVGYYLAGLGLLATLRRRWPMAVAWWANGLHVEIDSDPDEYLIGVAGGNLWHTSCLRSYHPMLAQWGRREPHRWQSVARLWLETMPPEQRDLELRWILSRGPDPIRIAAAPVRLFSGGAAVADVTRLNYGLGTIYPYSVPFRATGHPGHQISTWLAVLAWESWDIMRDGVSSRDWRRMAAHAWSTGHDVSPWTGWIAPVWSRPVELRHVSLLWRGRRCCAGRDWSDWLQTVTAGEDPRADRVRSWGLRLWRHNLRHTSIGAKSAEAWPAENRIAS